jgi:DNA repair protein RecO (recombination protein O)
VPLYSAEALILRTYKLGEADRIVVFLTEDRGKKRGVAKNARKSRRRFSGGLEPMTRGRVAYFEREHRELVRLDYVEPLRSPMAASGAEALGHAGYFAELIDEWAPEADPNERLFRLGVSVVEALASGAQVDRLARYFEYWLLRLQGVYPSLVRCLTCGGELQARGAVMAEREHLVRCPDCAAGAGSLLSPDALRFLRAAGRIGPDRLDEIALTGQAARQLERAHRRLIAMHLDKELKSARVLRELR